MVFAARSLVVLVLLSAVVVSTGCASQEGAGQTPVETTAVTMPPSYKFDPPAISVSAGATVVWTNRDNFTHSVQLLSGASWSSEPVRPGETTAYTFTKPGEYRYQCSFHPQDMKGRVVVGPA